MLQWVNGVWHRNRKHFWGPARAGLPVKMGMNMLTITLFHLAKLSPVVNLLTNVHFSTHIVNLVQNVLSQVFPSLLWAEAFQHCLQARHFHHHHRLLVASSRVASLVGKRNALSSKHRGFNTHCTTHDCTVFLPTVPVPPRHAFKWTWPQTSEWHRSYLAEDHEVRKPLPIDERDFIELVRYLKLEIYCFHNMKKNNSPTYRKNLSPTFATNTNEICIENTYSWMSFYLIYAENTLILLVKILEGRKYQLLFTPLKRRAGTELIFLKWFS